MDILTRKSPADFVSLANQGVVIFVYPIIFRNQKAASFPLATVNIGPQPVSAVVCLDICFNHNFALIVSIMWLESGVTSALPNICCLLPHLDLIRRSV